MITASRKKSAAVLCLTVALCLILTAPASAELPRGDYDNDGISDLAVGSVQRSGLTGTTAYTVRGSAFGLLYWTFNRPADAFAPGRFFPGWGTVPATVLVTSSSEPLLWTIKTPQLQEAAVRYGLPGDTIANLIDWDGDAIDDFQVVRAGEANELGDGLTHLHWYCALSGRPGEVVETVFGLAGDKVFTFYDEHRPRFGLVRVSTAGECQGQFEWYSMGYADEADEHPPEHRCWGLPGDIPLVRADYNGNGRADWIVVRPHNGIQTAYVMFDDQQGWTAVNLGRETAIPMFGNVIGESGSFAWSQRDYGAVGIRRADNSDYIFQWGGPEFVTIRPDGTVVQPDSNDRLISSDNGGGDGEGELAGCRQFIRQPFLWKPESQDSGPPRLGFALVKFALRTVPPRQSCAQLLSSNGQAISVLGRFADDRYYEGYGCGLEDGRETGLQLAAKARALTGSPSGYVKVGDICYGPIPDLAVRWGRHQ